MKPYYENENGKLYHAHNVDFCKTLPDSCIDLTVTSPPYDNLRDYNGYSFDFIGIANELFRVTKKGGVVVWVVNDSTIKGSESGTSFKQALYFKEIGFNLHDTMIYQKDKPPENSNRYEQGFEYMFILTKGTPEVFNPIKIKSNLANRPNSSTTDRQADGTKKSRKTSNVKPFKTKNNIWKYGVGYMKSTLDKIAYQHPAIFPEALASDHIISWSNERGIIFDPFSGSGTTAKMAEVNDRNWIACDESEEYCKIAKQRIEAENRQLKLF